MSIHPFDDADTSLLVLVKDQGQQNLWPVFADVSVGWRPAYGEAHHAVSLDHIEHIWTDIRPRSLREGLAAGGFPAKPPGLGPEDGVE